MQMRGAKPTGQDRRVGDTHQLVAIRRSRTTHSMQNQDRNQARLVRSPLKRPWLGETKPDGADVKETIIEVSSAN